MFIQNPDVVIFSSSRLIKSLGPYRLATDVRNLGLECQVVDYVPFWECDELTEAIEKIVGSNTKVVGLSLTFINLSSEDDLRRIVVKNSKKYTVEEIFKKFAHIIDVCKRINPKIKIVTGGAFQMQHPEIDVVFKGFSDVAFSNYLKDLDAELPTKPFIINGDVVNESFEFNKSQTVYHESDNTVKDETLMLEVSRGCIFKCKFCSYPLLGKNKNDYIKDRNKLYEEFIKNYNEYGTTRYIISDDTHNDNIVKLEMMADIAQSLPFKLEYSTYLRIDLLKAHPEQYTFLKDSGLKGAYFGIESLNYESAKAIGKGIRTEKAIEELYKFKDLLPHVKTTGSFIAGLPFETKSSIYKWVDIISKKGFPLDSCSISPLSIIKNASFKFYQSEFELNSEKYYTWTSDHNWHNGHFDRQWALDNLPTLSYWASMHKSNIGAFTYPYLTTLGYTEEDMSQGIHALTDRDIRSEEFINNYKSKFK